MNAFCGLLQTDLDDAIAQLKCDVDVLKCVQSGPSTSATATLPVQSKPAAFMTTKVLSETPIQTMQSMEAPQPTDPETPQTTLTPTVTPVGTRLR